MTAWVRLELDLAAFDETPFLPCLDAATAAGVALTTMARLGDGARQRRRLEALWARCAADDPGADLSAGVPERCKAASYDPDGAVVAVEGEHWVGLSVTSLRPLEGYAFGEMTGVVPERRGRGLAVAMKLEAVRWARSRGHTRLRTFHHPDNAAAIGLNLRLGATAPSP